MIVASQLNSFTLECGALPASVQVSWFHGDSGVDEFHVIVRPAVYGTIGTQLDWMLHAYNDALDALGLDAGAAVFKRFFCSDLANQAAALESRPFANARISDTPCATSWIGQPPAPPAKAALWAYLVNDPDANLEKTQTGATMSLQRGALTHHWTTGESCVISESAYAQTQGILESYNSFVRGHGMSFLDNVVRTWFFAQNIDTGYQGLVNARKEFFAAHGLTPNTHFVASTGIEGTHANPLARVSMDAYAIAGAQPRQIQFLNAPDHLCPANDYGVTFERGTAIAYRDRKHVIVSGTASVDNQGKIVYPGNVSRQLDRTLDNIDALLRSAGATLNDICLFIAYVRDPNDAGFVDARMRERFGDAPIQVVTAPVCRPGWLVEVEGMALIPSANPDLPAF